MLLTGLKVVGTALAGAAKVAASAVVTAVSGVKAAAAAVVTATTTGLADIVTAEMMGGVLDEVVSLLPVCIPVMIGFIALRKGISFISAILHSA